MTFKDALHQAFKGRWGVTKSKRHDIELVESVLGDESGLWPGGFSEGDLPVAGAEVQGTEEVGAG